MRRTIVGVMGGSVADEKTTAGAHELGRLIAQNGWVLVSGGRPTGVMQATVTGAREAGGLTVGVLYDEETIWPETYTPPDSTINWDTANREDIEQWQQNLKRYRVTD